MRNVINWQREQQYAAVVLPHAAPGQVGIWWCRSQEPPKRNGALDVARIVLGLGRYSVIFARLGGIAVRKHAMALFRQSPLGSSSRWVKVAELKSTMRDEKPLEQRAPYQRLSVGGYLLLGMLWLYMLATLILVGRIILASPLLHVLPPLLH